MERVKDLNKVTLRGDGLLVELVEKETKSNLILPESVSGTDFADYIKVIAVGSKVEDIHPGDIILDVGGEISTFLVGEKRLSLLYRGGIILTVSPDNFDFGEADDAPESPEPNVNI